MKINSVLLMITVFCISLYISNILSFDSNLKINDTEKFLGSMLYTGLVCNWCFLIFGEINFAVFPYILFTYAVGIPVSIILIALESINIITLPCGIFLYLATFAPLTENKNDNIIS